MEHSTFHRNLPLSRDRRTKFGKQAFTDEERETIQGLLQRRLGLDEITTRPGHNGETYTYVEGWKSNDLANSNLGYDGWASSIVDVTIDFIDETPEHMFKVGATSVIRITIKDGSFHEDVGYGCQTNKSKATAIENAKKEAITDGRKRALRLFGNVLGNCLYDKEYIKSLSDPLHSSVQSKNVKKDNNTQPQQNSPAAPKVKQEPVAGAPATYSNPYQRPSNPSPPSTQNTPPSSNPSSSPNPGKPPVASPNSSINLNQRSTPPNVANKPSPQFHNPYSKNAQPQPKPQPNFDSIDDDALLALSNEIIPHGVVRKDPPTSSEYYQPEKRMRTT